MFKYIDGLKYSNLLVIISSFVSNYLKHDIRYVKKLSNKPKVKDQKIKSYYWGIIYVLRKT